MQRMCVPEERLVLHRGESQGFAAASRHRAALDASSRAFGSQKVPAGGPPLHVPSETPGVLIQNSPSTRGCCVTSVPGRRPRPSLLALHHSDSSAPAAPFRLVSTTYCLSPVIADSLTPSSKTARSSAWPATFR